MATLRCLLVTAIAALSMPSPGLGQCRLCDVPTTVRTEEGPSSDVQLQIETNLNFDRLILAGSGTGAVRIRPDGSSSSEGAVAQVGPRAMVGTVLVQGEPGRALRIELPRRIELYSLGGGRASLQDIESDADRAPHLDAAGKLSFRFGGRLVLTGDTDGQFRGDLPITVEYAQDGSATGILTSR